ncbi:HAMP domain-containing sensor histidine kinase [Actinomadura sp. WMMB 499]|uniref:sensor histidine kinase n=1 Tax=Actinomadura sp. WMMB 499 TaxID=1219491 RepID=UPI001245CED3|nr:HAMP domain-containing sensor histidine kinase [Actinomadura sp. WMMB 499]QFG21416.1 HAMP domain-containing histidine kinase [Actinomadura sp. WMMB 499]
MRIRFPFNTVRFRLTLLYGALFLLSGAVTLGITFFLVDRATQGTYFYQGEDGITTSIKETRDPPRKQGPAQRDDSDTENRGLTPPDEIDDEQIAALARHQKQEQRRTQLVQSGIALAIMSLASIGLGWVVAGRILRRLRVITAATREISATNLHERLALPGPADELKDLGDTIDELLARLEGAFEAQRRFVANASHELRTPMARQRTLSQVALADPDATAESLRDAHLRVIAAGRHQERLVAALLTLARGQAGIERRVPVDLGPLTDQVVRSRRAEAGERGVTLDVSLRTAIAAGDPGLAERLVTNLVDNALRHNVPDGRVTITTGTDRGRPVLTVDNTGPVVPPDALDRLFMPFQRLGTERTGRSEGLGLGLSIVQAVATAHDARLDAEPRPGGGLTITLCFPSPDAAAEPAGGDAPGATAAGALTADHAGRRPGGR